MNMKKVLNSLVKFLYNSAVSVRLQIDKENFFFNLICCTIEIEYITGENCRQFRLLKWTSFIGQFIHLVGGDGIMGMDREVVILASTKFHFIRVHDNLM